VTIRLAYQNPQSLESLRSRIAQGLSQAAAKTGEQVVEEAFKDARARARSTSERPFFGRGGYYRSLGRRHRRLPGRVAGSLFTNHPAGRVLEFGSRPHLIRPRGKRALFWAGGRHPVKQVRHPGTPAYHVLEKAAQGAAQKAGGLLKTALSETFKTS